MIGDKERLKRYPAVLWGAAWREFMRVKGRTEMICTEELIYSNMRCDKPFAHLGIHNFIPLTEWIEENDHGLF